jgi:hypothetical protein
VKHDVGGNLARFSHNAGDSLVIVVVLNNSVEHLVDESTMHGLAIGLGKKFLDPAIRE